MPRSRMSSDKLTWRIEPRSSTIAYYLTSRTTPLPSSKVHWATRGESDVSARRRVRSLALACATAFLVSPLIAFPALACRTSGGIVYFPASGPNFEVGQFTTAQGYRGVHAGISVGSSSAPPNADDYHISVQISSSQSSQGSQFGEIWSQVGWQMGILQRLPSGSRVYSSSATVYFEGIDNVESYRDTYGAAETLGRYEVSEGGISPTGRWKYIAWFQRAGVWYQAGYSELDAQLTQESAFGEASDTINQQDTCLQLSAAGASHEVGSPDQLLVLQSGSWIAWTTAVSTGFSPDNGLPYDYANFGNYDHFTVSGP